MGVKMWPQDYAQTYTKFAAAIVPNPAYLQTPGSFIHAR